MPDIRKAAYSAALENGDINAAEAHCVELIKLDPFDSEYRLMYGKLLFDEGRNSEAFDQLEKALEASPESAEVLAFLGKALYEERRFAEASVMYSQAFKYKPDEPDYLLQLGKSCYRNKDYFNAEEHFREHAVLKPLWEWSRIWYARALFRNGKLSEAVEEYLAAAELNPSLSIPYSGLGDIALESGDSNSAENWYMKALEKDAQNTSLQDKLNRLKRSRQ